MWSVRYIQVQKEDLRGNQEESCTVLNQISLTDDSSIATASDSEEQADPIGDLDIQEPELDLLNVDVFDPDKDRDSSEDVRDEARISEAQLEKVKVEELIDISGEKGECLSVQFKTNFTAILNRMNDWDRLVMS